MADRVEVHVDSWMRQASVAREFVKLMRREGNRVKRAIQDSPATPEVSGNLKRRLSLRVGIDSRGPYARIGTFARNPRTDFRYGLSTQQRKQYLEIGLQRTPRRR